MTNPEHTLSDDAMKNKPMFLWNHLFADQHGYLALFSDARGPDPRRLLACAVGYFSQPTAIIESSPVRLQMWWRLDSGGPPETGQDLNRRLAYDTTASGNFDNHGALTEEKARS